MFGDSPFQNAIREIKVNAHHMKKALETGDMKETLKYSREMLFQLRTEEIETREYYQLYILAFDELGWLSENLQLVQLEKKKYDLYEIVQYSKTILPRIYLMICVGSVLVNKGLKDPMNFLNDVFKMCKGVQHPCRGLFLRYYLLKILRLRIEKNDMTYAQLYDQVLPFLLQNFKEMNGLWIRINNLVVDKETRKQERKNLGITLADNLSQISTLPGLDLDIYKEKILNPVLEIILESQDKISQSFLFDIFLSVFPVEFHIPNLQTILEATKKIYRKVNINNIYLKIMERFSEYAKNNKIKEHDQNNNIYNSFKTTLQSIFDSKKYSLARNLQLLQGFMKFSVFFYNNNFDYINEILEMTKQLCLKASEEERNQPKAVQCLEEILSLPLQKFSVLVLVIEQFPYLMELLPIDNQKKVVIQIVEAIQKTNTYLITQEICQKVLIFLKPLFKTKNEQEIQELSKIIHFVYSCKPKQFLELLFLFEKNFDIDNPLHLKSIYPVFLFRILKVIRLTNQMKSDLQAFWNSQQEQEENPDEEALHQTLKQYYRQKYSKQENASYLSEQEKENFNVNLQDDFKIDFEHLSEKIYDINFNIQIQSPLLAQQVYLELSLLINQYGNNENSDNLLYECYSKIYEIFQNEIGLLVNRTSNFNKITGYLSNITNVDEKILQDIKALFYSSICLLGNRQQQAEATLRFSNLYVNDEYNLKQCFQRCFQLIKMTKKQNPQSVLIYIKVLDYMLYYKTQVNELFQDEEVNQLVEMINNSQDTFKDQPAFLEKFDLQKRKLFKHWNKSEKLSEAVRNNLKENNQSLFINGQKFQSQSSQKIKSRKGQIDEGKDNLAKQRIKSCVSTRKQRILVQRKTKNKWLFGTRQS